MNFASNVEAKIKPASGSLLDLHRKYSRIGDRLAASGLEREKMTAYRTPFAIVGYIVCALIIGLNFDIEQDARSEFAVDFFSLWIAAPFILLALTLPRSSSGVAFAEGLALTVLIGACGAWACYVGIRIPDGQSAFVFLYIPLLQLIAAVVIRVRVTREKKGADAAAS